MDKAFVRGLKFNYMRMGSGQPTIVFVHGLLLDNLSSIYLTLGPTLAKKTSLILYDQRGHGRSDQPDSEYKVSDFSDDLRALLDEWGETEPVVVAGHSYGGLIALRFALDFPEMTAGLILLDSLVADEGMGERVAEHLKLQGEDRRTAIDKVFGQTDIRLRGRWLDALVGRGQALAGEEAKPLQPRTPMVQAVERLLGATTLIEDVRATPPMTDADLTNLACPIIALYGEHSDMLEDGRRLAAAAPDCRLVIIDDVAHGIVIHARERICQEIIAWLDETDLTRRD